MFFRSLVLAKRWRMVLSVGVLVLIGLIWTSFTGYGRTATNTLSGFLPSTSSISNGHWRVGAGADSDGDTTHKTSQNATLHMIIPATSSNKNLCKLMLSAATLGYPSPVFIRWGSPEADDEYVQHLAKVDGILKYLNSLDESEQDDLVFIVDGYDMWLQLDASVLIQRYLDIVDAANGRLRQRFGEQLMREHDIYESIVFGADKMCFPENPRIPNCWAIPNSTLPEYTFGPETDSGKWRHHNRPRWLNSGTILGPAKDLRDLFEATLIKIKTEFVLNSDQFYFAKVYAEQAYARTKLVEDPLPQKEREVWISDGFFGEGHREVIEFEEPLLIPDQRTEYHVTIDYESALFQTVGLYSSYIGWRQFTEEPLYHNLTEDAEVPHRPHRPHLPIDIATSPLPMSRMRAQNDGADNSIPEIDSWRDVPLGVNAATGQVFAVIHFIPPKHLRDLWWHRMWYRPYVRSLVQRISMANTTAASEVDPFIGTSNDGRNWYQTDRATRMAQKTGRATLGGGLAVDTNKWLSWELLCDAYERILFDDGRES